VWRQATSNYGQWVGPVQAETDYTSLVNKKKYKVIMLVFVLDQLDSHSNCNSICANANYSQKKHFWLYVGDHFHLLSIVIFCLLLL